MERPKTITVTFSGGPAVEVELRPGGDRAYAFLRIDGVFYHFERVRREVLLSAYRVDDDPAYVPQADAEGYCCIIAPFPDDGTDAP